MYSEKDFEKSSREAGLRLVLGIALICLFSTALSGHLSASFFGPEGRWQGAGMMLLYALLFCFFSSESVGEKEILLHDIIGNLALCESQIIFGVRVIRTQTQRTFVRQDGLRQLTLFELGIAEVVI